MRLVFKYCLVSSCILFFLSCQKQELSGEQITDNNSTQASKTSGSSIGVAARPTPAATQNLIRLYTEWWIKRDISLDPFDDATGAKQYAAQPLSSGTMMLASGFGPDLQQRSVNISLSQYQKIFIGPLGLTYYDNDCNDEISPNNGNIAHGLFKSISAPAFNSHNANMTVTLDGVSLVPSNIQNARGNSGFWESYAHSSWIGCSDFSTMTYADGFYFLVPLSLGSHTLNINASAYYPYFHFTFSNHVIYTLNIIP